MKKVNLKKQLISALYWAFFLCLIFSGGIWTMSVIGMTICSLFEGCLPDGRILFFTVITLPLIVWFWTTFIDDHNIDKFKKKLYPENYV